MWPIHLKRIRGVQTLPKEVHESKGGYEVSTRAIHLIVQICQVRLTYTHIHSHTTLPYHRKGTIEGRNTGQRPYPRSVDAYRNLTLLTHLWIEWKINKKEFIDVSILNKVTNYNYHKILKFPLINFFKFVSQNQKEIFETLKKTGLYTQYLNWEQM